MFDGTTKERRGSKLRDVWRACNKIRAAIFRVGLNLWDYYRPLDPNHNNLIPESHFISILTGPLRGLIGLSNQEIAELADYFRVQDGRVLYAQFCEVVQNTAGNDSSSVTGLQRGDPLHVNRLSATENRKLNLIIAQIARLVIKKELVLRPYFQDYELIAKNAGTVTITHFGRVLSFLGIVLASEEFSLLVKKYAKDGYTVNYVAFLKALDEVRNCVEQQQQQQQCGLSAPVGVITAELPRLSRPEIGRTRPSEVYRTETTFHPVTDQREKLELHHQEIVRRIRRHVFEHRIRVHDLFKDLDTLNAGSVTRSQFRRGLSALQVSGTSGRLCLGERETDAIVALYGDPNDPDRVRWLIFADDVDGAFPAKESNDLLTSTSRTVEDPVSVRRANDSSPAERGEKDARKPYAAALQRLSRKLDERRISLEQFFKGYDRHNRGHVTRSQARQVIAMAGIALSREEMFGLERRYNDELGFDYSRFLRDVEPPPLPEYSRKVHVPTAGTTTSATDGQLVVESPKRHETDIVAVLAKLKGKVVRERIKVTEFIRSFDARNEMVVSESDFVRGLDQLRCNLTCAEVATITATFQAPLRPGYIEYAKFGAAIEEAVTTGSLERSPLLVPVQHIPSEASNRNFLNFDERCILSWAMDKLCRQRDMNLEEIFKDSDKENIGTVSKDSLIKALSLRNMLFLLSGTELDVVHKCFGIVRGGRLEFDYRAFLRVLSQLQRNKENLPF